MRLLVTGATGFVGACLARRMVEGGHEVHVTIRSSSDCWRLSDLLPHLVVHHCDLRDEEAVAVMVAEARPEAVFHLATYGGFSFQRESDAIFRTNLFGTVNLVRACQRIGVSRFINTGSSSEYGIKDAPMREDDLLEPLGDYGVSKAATTLFCSSEAIKNGLPLATLRVFSPYGPWDDPHRLVPYAISSLLKGEAPRLSRPHFVRDYIHIDDVVAAYEAALEATFPTGEIFNIGSGVQTSLGELLGRIGEILPEPRPLWGVAEPRHPEPTVWVADIAKARQCLGWEPAISLRNGLAATVAWQREQSRYYQ